jgi:predicted ArsR family transcriptional regulator
MSTRQKILKYCLEPRTAVDIAKHCGLEKISIYTQLGALQRIGKIEKRGDGRRRAAPSTFVTIRQAPSATESTDDYENLVITFAHAPFGLRL